MKQPGCDAEGWENQILAEFTGPLTSPGLSFLAGQRGWATALRSQVRTHPRGLSFSCRPPELGSGIRAARTPVGFPLAAAASCTPDRPLPVGAKSRDFESQTAGTPRSGVAGQRRATYLSGSQPKPWLRPLGENSTLLNPITCLRPAFLVQVRSCVAMTTSS